MGSNPTLSAICTILCANLRFWTISCAIARLLGLNTCARAIMQDAPHNCGSGPECNRATSTVGYSWFQASSRKSRSSAQRRFWCGAASELRGAASGAKRPFIRPSRSNEAKRTCGCQQSVAIQAVAWSSNLRWVHVPTTNLRRQLACLARGANGTSVDCSAAKPSLLRYASGEGRLALEVTLEEGIGLGSELN